MFAECCVLVNSRSGLVTATLGAPSGGLHPTGAYLIPKLRYYFAEFLHPSSLKRLGILTLPTCVGFGYGFMNLKLRGFSWKHGINFFCAKHSLSRLSIDPPDLPKGPAYTLEPGLPTPGWLSLLRPPIAVQQYGNINPFPIDYAFLPRLRGRLTLRRLTLRRKPWTFGVKRFSPPLSLLMSAFALLIPPADLDPPSQAYGTLFYRVYAYTPAASVHTA